MYLQTDGRNARGSSEPGTSGTAKFQHEERHRSYNPATKEGREKGKGGEGGHSEVSSLSPSWESETSV